MVLVLPSPSHTKQQFDDFYYSFSTVALMVNQGGKNGIPNIYQPQVLFYNQNTFIFNLLLD